MKRIISVFIVLSLMASISAIGVFATTDSYDSADISIETAILSYLGINIEGYDSNAPVSRHDFAKYLAALLGVSSDNENIKRYFKDTNEAFVQRLAQMGIFKGSGDAVFSPQENIIIRDAAIAIMRSLGYEKHLDMMTEAQRLAKIRGIGLFDTKDWNADATVEDVIIILYNALDIPMMDVAAVNVGTDGETATQFSQNEDLTLLRMYRRMYLIKGQVMGNYMADVNNKNLSPKQIDIDGVVYSCETEQAMENTGKYVVAICSEGELYDAVTFIKEDTREELSLTINAEQNIKYSNNTISYSDSLGRSQRINLPKSIDVIYNGEKLTENVDSAFDISLGTVTLYKEKNTGIYNIAVIEEWQEGKVTLSDTTNEKVWTDIAGNCAELDFSDALSDSVYKRIYIHPSGQQVSPKAVLADDVLMVSRSRSGKSIVVSICKNEVSGTIQSTSTRGNNTYVNVNGDEYQTSVYLDASGLKPGVSVVLTLNSFGKIAGYKKVSDTNETIAYLYDAAQFDKSFDAGVKVKLYTEAKEHLIIPFADKVNFDGKSEASDAALAKLKDRFGVLQKQLIRYRVNKKGEISSIRTGASGDMLTELTNGYESCEYLMSQEILRPKYPLAIDYTKVFIVPPDGREDNERLFNVIDYKLREPFYASQNCKVRCYKTDNNDVFVDYVVYEMELMPTLTGTGVYPEYMIVGGKHNALGIDGETSDVLNGYVNYVYREHIVCEGVDVSGVDEGDIIRFKSNAAGEIANFDIVYDHSQRNKTWAEATWHNYNVIFGDVLTYEPANADGKQALLGMGSVHGDPTVVKEYIPLNSKKVKCMVYDSSIRGENKIYVGTLDDIIAYKDTNGQEYSSMFIERLESTYVTFFIIK